MSNMRGDYSVYDSLYEDAIRKGWHGWGSDSRVAKGPEQIRRILSRSYVPQGGKALELGCGEGHLCRLLADQGFVVTGVDVSTVAIAWAIEKNSTAYSITYTHANFCQPEVLCGKAFDLIVDGNCLHCIVGEDRPQFLRNVHRLLSENGVFFVSSLCSKGLKEVTIFRAGKPFRHVPTALGLVQELDVALFEVLDWEVHKRDEYDHICLFARKRG